MKYKISYSTKFKKGLKLANKQHKDLSLLWTVIKILQNGQKLPLMFKDHKLTGNLKNFRACHIEPDWVLVYCYIEDQLVLYLYNIGSHIVSYKGKY